MKITQEASAVRQTVLNIEVEPPEMERYLDRASLRLAQRLAVPGFRRGKAPRWMVERVVGRDGLLDEAIDNVVPEVTQKALEQEGLEWSAPPSVEVVQKEPLVLKATVALQPLMDLGDYRSLRVQPEPVDVDEEQVAKALEGLRREQAPWEPVERPVELDDLVVLDFAGTVDGESFFQQQAMPYIVSAESDVPLRGFAEALVGTGSQQRREFDLPIPSDYAEQRVAGKVCRCTVTVSEVKTQRLPALDDEFAKGVGQGFESLDSLKEQLRKNVRAAEEEKGRRAYEDKVVRAALDQATVELPPLLVKHESDHMLIDREQDLARLGLTVDGYLQSRGQTLEQMRAEIEAQAQQSLLRSLLLRKVADAENLQVDDEVVVQELNTLSQQVESQSRGRRRLRDDGRNRDILGRMQRNRKALERLVAIAQGKASEPVLANVEAELATPEGAGRA